MFLLVAVPIEKRPRQIMAGSIDIRRPQSSDTGAQKRGPKAKPILGRAGDQQACCEGKPPQTYMYKGIHRTAACVPTPTYCSITGSAGAIMLDPKLAASATFPSWNVIH